MPAAFLALAGVNLAQIGMGFSDPAWATLLNTVLLTVLAFLSQRGNSKTDTAARRIDENTAAIGRARAEAQSAARNAEDAARAAGDIGEAIRQAQVGTDRSPADPTVRVSDLPEIRRDLAEDINQTRVDDE